MPLDSNFSHALKEVLYGAELSCVYEAGPCGYELHRLPASENIECSVVAPSKIPRKSGDRIKNDKREALNLARFHRAGELTDVYVSSQEDEALRDLARAREDAQKALRQSKQQLGVFLPRHNLIFWGRSAWSKAFFNWRATIAMDHRAQQFTLQEYINTVEGCVSRSLSDLNRRRPLVYLPFSFKYQNKHLINT